MKKTILFCFMIALPSAVLAQLMVLSNGTTTLARTESLDNANLAIGYEGYNYSDTYKMGIYDYKQDSGGFIIGLTATAKGSTYSAGRAFGVRGIAGKATDGYNYGVLGALYNSLSYGAGIFGTTGNLTGIEVNGRYAGYFDGPTYVAGTLTATDVITPSDIRLKENIVSLSNTEEGQDETLDKVMNMNVIKYNYKDKPVEASDTGTVAKQNMQLVKQMHYGLSAQELQQLYPDLVREGQDGFLGVNYTELVPVLIRAIQELKGELDAVKGSDGNARKAPAATSVNTALAGTNVLYQNTPNPFKEQTTIRFSLADDAQSASICIFDMTGKMLKTLPVSPGESSVSLNGWELGEGMFLYTLIVNGKEIDTKRMIITK